MAIAFVRTFTGLDDFSAVVAITVPAAGCAAGNLLVVSVGGYTEGTTLTSVTDTQTNSYSVIALPVTTFTSQSISIGIAYSILGTSLVSGNTITATFTGANGIAATVDEYSGITPSSPLDQNTSQLGSFGSSHTSGSVTTTQADELLVGFHVFPTGRSWTPTGSFNENTEFDPFAFQVQQTQYRIVSSTGSYASTGNLSASQVEIGAIATFKGAASAGAAAGWVTTL